MSQNHVAATVGMLAVARARGLPVGRTAGFTVLDVSSRKSHRVWCMVHATA